MTKRERYCGFRRELKRWRQLRRKQWRQKDVMERLQKKFDAARKALLAAESEDGRLLIEMSRELRSMEGYANSAEEYRRWCIANRFVHNKS